MEERYLFKAKRTDNKEWVLGSYVYTFAPDKKSHVFGLTRENHLIVGENGNMVLIDKDTLCQCTGLKDKNGKLIWKNDIVNFLGHKGTIVFECGSFGIAYKAPIDWRRIEANILPITGCDNVLYACANDNFISLWEIYWNFNDEDDCLSTVEVVGNIFDNTELLENEV